MRMRSDRCGAAVTVACAGVIGGLLPGAGSGRAEPVSAPARTVAAQQSAARLETAPDRIFTAGDVRLRYREIGRGEPVVLLHGYADDLDVWRTLGDSLATRYRVVALDQRGFGRSSKFADPARYGPEMGADVLRLLDHLGVGRAHLVGHSMGAVVAAYVTTHHPDRVATASFVSGPFYADSASAARAMAPVLAGLDAGEGMRGLFRAFEPQMPDSVAKALSAEMMAANDRRSLTAVMRAFAGLTLGRTGASTARVPALVVVGSRDPWLANSREMAIWWPNARLVQVPGADHMGVLERTELLAAVRARLAGAALSRARPR